MVNTSYNNSYYQLPYHSGTTTGNQHSVKPPPTTDPLSSLSTTSSPYHLDLSAEAQAYLADQGTSHNTNSFRLTTEQQKIIQDILEKYKDSPFTQETFNKIQDDLNVAGLSPERLAALDQVRSFNPTMSLIDALNGKQTSNLMDTESQKTKSGNYMDDIIAMWESVKKEEITS